MYLHGTSRINEQGRLEIGGCDTVELAEKFGTPLYVYDETLIRENCRAFKRAFDRSGLRYQVGYASKAFCTMAMCKLIEEEGLCLDVVSAGELHTSVKAGFPADRIHFHGNNKTPEEIEYALKVGIGEFVVDNFRELELLGGMAKAAGKTVTILLRVSPGVEAHTHEYISTGQEDSKFGFDVMSGQAKEAIQTALMLEGIRLAGLHSHIGSQIFETDGFSVAVSRVADLYEWAGKALGYAFWKLNVGGGFGIRYTEEDVPLALEAYVDAITDAIKVEFAIRGLEYPEVVIEPGRSIVGAAGTTLYTVGSTKNIPGIRKYVSVNGGMTDNPRPALYQSKYEAMLANRALEPAVETVSIAGKCCESGDMLIWDIELPEVRANDILAVSCTGAYNYSMASNYNRIARPAVVFVKDGKADLVVKRETLDDLVQNDLVPERLLSGSEHSRVPSR
ncbi:diaminopimelate decarboxylase [Effusibacillus lacus]|uniref:Diaminopimelate decarboxylase n=1 Tax=Effusibacillus lacus TaxID=1348429 RepID=A0A292YSF8_9BACL|nr:diaminopimelate decarboxylase [Effusibacillus lacus]TCS76305.1 diaminopimelate decarboxylase [Effusibacillus lacus]GAX91851.1 diaminopimelate decarboxylase [Effusibacillus lacus]